MSTTPEHHTETVRQSISTNVMVTMVARVVYLITRFFVPPFVLARMSMEAYGLWATAFILVSYIGISTTGLSSVYSKYVAEYSARGEHNRANSLLSTGLILTTPLCMALFGVVYLFWPWCMRYLKITPGLATEARVVVLIVVGSFLLSLCTSAFSDALTGVQKEAANQWIWIAAYLFETTLIFVLVGIGHGVRGLAEAFLLRTLLEVVLSVIVAVREIRWLRISSTLISRESIRTIFSFGGVVQIVSLFAIGLNSIERVLAAPLIGLEASGLLDISKKLPGMAASIPNAFTNSLVPAASYLQGAMEGAAEARATLHKLFLKGARYMNLAAGYFCGFLAAASWPALFVWLGKQYDGAPLLASIFAVATQVHLMTGPGTSVLKGVGRPREEFYYCIPNILALAVFVPLSRLVLGTWTALGIGTAVAMSTVVSAVFFLRHANRILDLPSRRYVKAVVLPGFVPYAVAVPLALPAIWAVSQVGRWTGAGIVVLLGSVYTAVLAAVVYRLVLEQGERLWFRAVVANHLPRIGRVRVGEARRSDVAV